MTVAEGRFQVMDDPTLLDHPDWDPDRPLLKRDLGVRATLTSI